ncbi:aspartyl protease family protein [Dyella amyloliquefaciens]|uniref:aspartyl protease family protein n=1 Tax=Dyella amyloliquefaciens TaxID=1770545 RepID=UPI001E3BC8E7|nr:aspartyl protease family protein [Dyella amyloliquefaciens]
MAMWRAGCVGVAMLLAGPALAEDCNLKDYGTLPVQMVGNQATTMVKINGTDTRFMLDTGAFFNTMSAARASALGLKTQPVPFEFRLRGVGGDVSVQQTHVKEFGILDTTLKNIAFIVGGTDTGDGLLGANLLDLADVEIDLAHGKLTLFKAEHCDKASLAYWVKGSGGYNIADIDSFDTPYDRRTFFNVTINGKTVRALLDSGASATVLSRDAAQRLGIDLKGPNAIPGSTSMGIGTRQVRTWTVPIDSFSVGSETIQHSQMQVLDGSMGDRTDMLLGVDFLLAHHMFISNSTKKAFFTYNGGRVFTYASAQGDDAAADTGNAANGNNAAPKTAADYALQGEAHLSRGELGASIADMDEAIRMAPDQAAYYVARARAHEANSQADAALADLDKSLSLAPKDVDALLMRAGLRLEHKDRAGAAADVAQASSVAPAGSKAALTVAYFDVEFDQPAAALPLLDDWVRLHRDDAMLGTVLNERCWARGLSNQLLDDALKDCRKAISRDGKKPYYLDSLGLVQLRLGNYPESIKAYEQAVAGNPDSAWSRYGLGLARIRSGQTETGNADLAAARSLDAQVDARASKFGLTASTP